MKTRKKKDGRCGVRVLMVLCVVALSLPNVVLFFTEDMPMIAKACNVVLPMSVYLWLMTIGGRPGRVWLWLLPMEVLAAFQVVLLYLFGNSVIAPEMFLNLTTTNKEEAGELLGRIYPAVVAVVIVYAPLLVWSVVWKNKKADKEFVKHSRRISQWGMAAGVVLLVANYTRGEGYSVKKDLYPVNVLRNACEAVAEQWKTKKYGETSRGYVYGARSERDAGQRELYVLVIGETARAANFGVLGYERNTTPNMSARKDVVVFGKAYTQSNTTHKSVPMLMAGVSEEDYEEIYSRKSVITAFKEAGYSTAFISNQRRNGALIEYMGNEADVVEYVKDGVKEGDNVLDEVLGERLRHYLDADSARKRMVVLHTYGSHFDYSERYRKEKARFVPDRCDNVTAAAREALVNAYDNSICATDELLAEVMEMVEKECDVVGVVYVSDHGEDIFDDGSRRFLHSSPKASEYQLHVPLLVWTSVAYDSIYPEMRRGLMARKNDKIITNKEVAEMLMEMAGVTRKKDSM